jgi:hypothetical protein
MYNSLVAEGEEFIAAISIKQMKYLHVAISSFLSKGVALPTSRD